MSSEISLTAALTTLVLNGEPITDFGADDYIVLTPVNEKTNRTNASEGGVTIADRIDAGVYDMVVRVQKKSASDVFLNALLNNPATQVIEGSAKEAFTRDGTPGSESWTLEGGSFTVKPTDTKNNTDGNALVEYTIQFRNATRNL